MSTENNTIIEKMKETREKVYWYFFHQGFGESCHAFLEFNGVLSKYIDLCARADEAGIDFTRANTHTEVALPMENHDADYLAEKLDCIFGPSLRANPEALETFISIMRNGGGG